MKLILGIDPGFSGGLALLRAEDGELEGLWAMPLRSTGSILNPLGKRPEIAIDDLFYKLKGYQAETVCAVLEYVSASPQMGVTSAFRFGEGYGVVKGILAALEIRLQTVMPAVWKGELGLTSIKQQSLDYACGLWPNLGAIWAKKKNDGLAEAALLARYGWEKFYKNKLTGQHF